MLTLICTTEKYTSHSLMKINKIQWYIKILNVTVLQEKFKYCKIYVLCISLKYVFFFKIIIVLTSLAIDF